MERRVRPRPQRVLVVDDSPDIREMWREWLTFWGFIVDEAENGAVALEKARTQVPDLVLMDLWMPVVDGVEATKRLKASPRTSQVPILALSAHVFPPAEARARAAGCEAFLPKPVDPDELLNQIRAAFARARAIPTPQP